MKPIIFLDIDGVLVTERWMRDPGYRPGTFDRTCVEVLNWLTSMTGAEIVISSTWRRMKLDGGIAAILKREGVLGTVIGITPDVSHLKLLAADVPFDRETSRGEEIQAWLDVNTARAFVIIDDDQDMGDLLPHLIHTDFQNGLTYHHALAAAAKLEGDR